MVDGMQISHEAAAMHMLPDAASAADAMHSSATGQADADPTQAKTLEALEPAEASSVPEAMSVDADKTQTGEPNESITGPERAHELSLTSTSQANTSSAACTDVATSWKPGFVSTVPALTSPLRLEDDLQASEAMISKEKPQASGVSNHSAGPTEAPRVHPAQGPVDTVRDTFDLTHSAAAEHLLSPPGPTARADDKVDFLQQQLDSFGADKPMLGDLMSLGGSGSERRQGGTPFVFSFPPIIFSSHYSEVFLHRGVKTLLVLWQCSMCFNISLARELDYSICDPASTPHTKRAVRNAQCSWVVIATRRLCAGFLIRTVRHE